MMAAPEPVSMLMKELAGEPLFRDARVRIVEKTDSTQDDAWMLARRGSPAVVIARHQMRGRGRRGRTWWEMPGKGLALSVAFDATIVAPVELSPRVGAAACEALASFLPQDRLALKWPNDVVDARTARKVAGVLIEVRDTTCIAGIGVNIQHEVADLAPQIRDRACSLAMLGGTTNAITCACRILAALGPALRRSWPEVARFWEARNWLVARSVRLTMPDGIVEGVVEALDPVGQIVVRTADGSLACDVRTVGEVRVLDHMADSHRS